jgi:folate-dependent phosphoribosylglycinamide formyltransferase PurN
MLLRSPIMLRIFLALKDATFPFEDLGSDPASPSIGEALKRDGIDLCFHKLGFIIKKGTIDGPRLGIINDHWGALPYVRGRSTIEWSLMHGIPLVATTHLVDEGIDTGRLIAMFDYSRAIVGASSVSEIREIIKRDADRRAVLSICRLANGEDVVVGNSPTLGATFYSMHPELTRFLERIVLRL